MTKHTPFRYFKTSPEIIRLTVMLYVRFPLSLRNVEDFLHEQGIVRQNELETGRAVSSDSAVLICLTAPNKTLFDDFLHIFVRHSG